MESTVGQVIKCRAAVAWEAGKPLVIEEVEVAPPQAMEVRLKILYTSLCHTDVYFWEAKGQKPIFPRILGHEAAGIVESVGEGVTDLAPGDHVLPVFTGECKECAHCLSEESNMCNLLRINTDRGVMLSDGQSRFTIKGKPINHFLGTSTFIEYTVVHSGCVAKINPLAPLDREGVTDLAPGDHVLPVFTGECKECAHCLSEESNMCNLLRINTDRGVMLSDGQSRFTIKGKPINHFLGTSTFSEYTVVHSGCVAKINPLAPLDKVCVLSCGFSTGFGATVNVAKPTKGSTVAVFGLGAVGLAAAEGARVSGASRIIGVDVNPKRFEEAKKFGVNEFVNPKDYDRPVQEVIAEMTGGGADRSVECTGNIDAMISAFECVHDGWGVAVLVGVPHKDAVLKTHPVNFLNERTLKGTFFGNYKPRSDLPSVVERYMNKEIELEKFITHEVTFSEINKAFDYMLQGASLRCIIRMDG
ncbi:alcohol dehydrogenase 3 isoform X1 [Musa acuminata AAA Group]|uniref:alcohol dehydrogenase 3 isoform X1 n=1 Tax=Musa acuminata AAA Group TaxID=214697 RepID=UPI0031D60835